MGEGNDTLRTEQLRYVILLDRYHSLTKIGNKLGVSYQTVDFGLRGLEQELGVSLVDRCQSGIVLTDYGQVVKRHAEVIVAKYDQMKQAVGAGKRAAAKLLLESSAIPNYVFLQDMCTAAELSQRNLEVSVFRKSNREIITDIIMNKTMLGFITVHDLDRLIREHQQNGLMLEVLYEDQSYVAMGLEHPLSKQRILHPKLLKGFPVSIFGEDNDALAEHIVDLEEQAGMSFRTNDARAFEQSLLNDCNIGFITRSLAQCQNFWDHKDRLAFCPLKAQTQPVIAAVYSSHETAAKLAVIATFLEMIRAYL